LAGSGAGRRLRRIDAAYVAALATGAGAFVVYRSTLLPGLSAWDTGEAQTVPPILGTMHPTGFPAYALLGWLVSVVLAPLGSPAFLMNLMSALLIASAVGLTVLVNRRLGVALLVCVAAAIGFALAPLVWRVGVAADAHGLHAVLLVAIVGLLLRWEALVGDWRASPDDPRLRARADRGIVLAAAVFGVALANHGLTLLLIPAVGLFVLAVEPRIVRRPRVVLAALAACFGVAALLYIELPLRAGAFRAPLVYGHPETWSGFWDVVLARQFQGDVARPLTDVSGKVGDVVHLALAQFGLLVILVPSGFLLAVIGHPRYALLSGVAVLTTCFFASSYENAAIERYYVGPVFFSWTWLAILGGAVVDSVMARLEPTEDGEPEAELEATTDPGLSPSPRPAVAAPSRGMSLVGSLVALGVGVALLVPTVTQLPVRWRVADLSHQTWVHRWLDEALASLEPNALVLSWWSYSTPLWYGQLVEHRRPDLWVVDDRTRLDEDLGSLEDVIEANLDTRPVYLIRLSPLEIAALSERYVIENVETPGNLYRVVRRMEPT
jgi:hypothetical protein